MQGSFKNIILGIRLKVHAQAVANSIIDHQFEIDELMDYFFSDDWVLCQRAAWPVGVLAEENPEIIRPYLPRMLRNLDAPIHDAVIRNTVRAWSLMSIPENLQGEIYNKCFSFLCDPNAPIAVRVFAMTVCTNIATLHPLLASEIITVIQDHFDHSSAGFRSRAKKELKKLNGLLVR